LILVVLGTHELPFTRLLDEVERVKRDGLIQDEIIVQHGHTKYNSEHLTLKPFFSFEKMDLLYEQASLIITHAGTGSVINGLRKGKTVIAAPRLKKYGEHNDDHQLELVEVFTEQGHILPYHENDHLENVLKAAQTFVPRPYESGNKRMVEILEGFISEI
jgi:UDP-N-acetylglucosamine transferase subunit ALG13